MKKFSMLKAAVLSVLLLWLQHGVAGLPAGDAARGERVFWQCRTCHYPEKVVGHNNGPSLWAIFGQQVGSQPGFDYSPVLQQASFTWTPELMDVWLRDPQKFLPGNMMMSSGIEDAGERADLIEYLKLFQQ
jgi:cytochrome c